tara:strand:+ start:7128 stop:7661 length:534 start_codon:yes stop_codon:yes gene_type:complete
MFCIEDEDFLQEPQRNHIDKLLNGIDFPVYFMDHGLTNDGNAQFVHSIIKRPEGCPDEERFNSPYVDFFMSCIMTFMMKHKIKINKVERMAVNCCYNNGSYQPGIHSDHEYEHKQFILYLNTPMDKNTPTLVFDKDCKTLLKEIYPKQYKGACFDGLPHTFTYPSKGLRWALIVTFT